MNSYTENQHFFSIATACLNLIEKERSHLRRTKSQIPATSELWFLECDLKKIKSHEEFLIWAEETFFPQLEKQRYNQNRHVMNIFTALALEIASQIQRSDHFTSVAKDSFAKLMGQCQIENGTESPSTPILKKSSDNAAVDHHENWNDAINQVRVNM